MRRAMWLWQGGVCAALALTACEQDTNRARQETPAAQPGGPAMKPGEAAKPGEKAVAPGANVDAIKESPERFYGKTVRLAGEVDEVYGDRAFELEGTEWALNDNIIVLTKTPVRFGGMALSSDDEIVVFGTVRPFVVADVERDLGWDIGSDVEVKISKRPVIVAETIRRVGEYGVWSVSGAPEAALSTTLMIVATMDPKALAGRKVDLRRERVQAMTGKGLWVGPSLMGQVFVLPSQAPTDVQVGDWVHVTGTLQRAPKDAAKGWGLPPRMEGLATEDMVFVDSANVSRAKGPPPEGQPAGKPEGQQPGPKNIQ